MSPHLLEEGQIVQELDVEKLETLICLESLIVVCYQSLAGLVHNQTIRRECRQFERRAQYHQEKIRNIFPLSSTSEVAVETRVSHHLLQLKPSSLSLRELINLAFNLTVLKTDIYKYFSRMFQEHYALLNTLFEENAQEMDFLRQERDFHQNKVDIF